MLCINYYDNFTDLLYNAKLMKLFLEKSIFISLIFLISMTGNSCSSHLREAVCKGNNTYRVHSHKKNKSNYNQKYSYKSRSVKKDYVIKNGIAH